MLSSGSGNEIIPMNTKVTLRTDRLYAIRKQHGMSQRELARLCGLGETQISKYESGAGEPNIESLKRICQALNVSTDYLVGLTDDLRGHISNGQLNDDERAVLTAYQRDGWPGVLRLGADQIAQINK